MLARLALCVLLGIGATACGSRVAFQTAAPAVASDGGVVIHADPAPGQAPGPVPAAAPPLETPAAAPKETICDWHAKLEGATAGRPADWTVLDTGAWGRAEVPGTRIWIAPRTPCEKVHSVALHEWTHHMQGVVYGDWGVVKRELARYGGAEAVADCGALLLGATWVHYGCPTQKSSRAAFAILRGERP